MFGYNIIRLKMQRERAIILARNLQKNNMEIKNYNSYFFFLVLIGISLLAFFIIQPFFVAILLASIMAVIFHRPYIFFLKLTRGRQAISALATSLLGCVLVLALATGLFLLISNEAGMFYRGISTTAGGFQKYVDSVATGKNSYLVQTMGVDPNMVKEASVKLVSQSTDWILGFAQKVYQGVAQVLFLLFVVFFSLYYFLIGGKDLVKKIMYISPLKDSHEKLLIDKFVSISRATIRGALVIAFIQGAIGTIMLVIAGVPSAAILGVFMMFFSLIPMVGSGIVWLPAGIIMLLLGNIWQGIFILVVGFGVISVIDNFLRPRLVGKDIQMHPLIVLFATIGGLQLFGFFGFIIGPVIMALFLTLWDIYAIEFKRQLKQYNA
jgi:predicted PurR-regulated permease PerM